MRLLAKQEVQNIKTSERKLEIDQAFKLATRVDTLRQTVADEEVNLTKFRNETVKKIQGEIDSLIHKKSTLENDVKNLSEEKKSLQIPLDKEWEKVREKRTDLVKVEHDLSDREFVVKRTEMAVLKVQKDLDIEESRIKDRKSLSEQKLKEADEILLSAKDVELKTLEDQVRARTYFEEKEKGLVSRETELNARERDVENGKKNNDKVRKSLSLKEAQLIDREQTLDRSIERLRKQGINIQA